MIQLMYSTIYLHYYNQLLAFFTKRLNTRVNGIEKDHNQRSPALRSWDIMNYDIVHRTPISYIPNGFENFVSMEKKHER